MDCDGEIHRLWPYRYVFHETTTPDALALLQRQYRKSPHVWIFQDFRALSDTLRASHGPAGYQQSMTMDEWNFGHDPLPPGATHHHYYALLAQVNGALLLMGALPAATNKEPTSRTYDDRQRREKLRRFLDAHVPLVQWIQGCTAPSDYSDQALDRAGEDGRSTLDRLYPRPEPYFSRNDLVQQEYHTTEQHRPSPQQVLAQCFPTRTADVFCEFSDTVQWLQALDGPRRAALYQECRGYPHWPLGRELVVAAKRAVDEAERAAQDAEERVVEMAQGQAALPALHGRIEGALWPRNREILDTCTERLGELAQALRDDLFSEVDTDVQGALESICALIEKAAERLIEKIDQTIPEPAQQVAREAVEGVEKAVKKASEMIASALDSEEVEDGDSLEDAVRVVMDAPRTLEEVPTRAVQEAVEEARAQVLRTQEELSGAQRVLFDVAGAARSLQREWWTDHTVVTALLYRVHCAHECMEGASRPLLYQLQLFVDTHLSLAQHFGDSGALGDEAVQRDDGTGLSPLQRHYPHPTCMFHEGDLPCMTKGYNYVNFLSDSGMSMHDWHYINSKLTPKCCLGRGFNYIHESKCVKSDAILKWARLALEASLLGVYEHADCRPVFAQRLRVHKYMNSHMDKGALFDFQYDYDALVLFAEREFMITQIKYCTALYETICTLYDGWQAFERSVLETMDVVRHIYSETGSLQQATEAIVSLSSNDKPRVYRQQTTDFFKFLVTQLQAVDEKMFMESENPRGCVIDESLIEPEQRERIERFVESLVPGQPVRLEWLQSFGLDTGALGVLRKCRDIFNSATTTDVSMREILPHLYVRHYSVVGYFARLYQQHSTMRVMEVDADTYLAQMRAVRRRYNLEFADALPRQVGVFYYAPCCQQVKSFLPSDKIKVAFGQIRLIYDDENNRLVCGHRSDRNDTKKRKGLSSTRTGRRPEPEKVVRRRKFKGLMKARSTVTCLDTDAVRVPLLGRIIEIDTVRKGTRGPFTVCTGCGFTTPFAMHRYHTNGFLCDLCAEQEREISKKELEQEQRPDVFPAPYCFACRNTSFAPGTKQEFGQYCLLDDLPEGDLTFRYMQLCAGCNKHWVQKSAGTLLCSDIMRGLRDYRPGMNFFDFFGIQ